MKSVQNNICSSFLRSIVASALTKNPKECTLFACFLNTSGHIISNSSFESPGISFDTNPPCNQTGIKKKICSCFTIWERNLLKIKQGQLPEALMEWSGAEWLVLLRGFALVTQSFCSHWWLGGGRIPRTFNACKNLTGLQQYWNNWVMLTGLLVKRLQGNVPPLCLPSSKYFK